jgi:hypothetical protein
MHLKQVPLALAFYTTNQKAPIAITTGALGFKNGICPV